MSYLAKIEFLKVDDPECKVKYLSGLRSMLSYKENELWDCSISFSGCDEASPGKLIETEVYFLTPQAHADRIKQGMEFSLYAGYWRIEQGKFK